MKRKIKKEIITGTCIDLSSEGKGIIKDNGRVILVNGLFIDEEAEVELLYKRAGVYYAKIKKLIKKSLDRIEPKCKVCTACGGCQFQQLSYLAQLKYKTNKVKESLLRIGHIESKVNDCIGMDEPYNYRNKVQVPFGYNKFNKVIYGFFKENSHEIIEIDNCYIEDKRARKILKTIKELLPRYNLHPYDEDKLCGELRHVLIRTSNYKKEIMVVLVMNLDDFKGRNNFVRDLVKICPEITTIVLNINKRKTDVILGEKEKILYGSGFILDKLCNFSFRISPKSFYQINPVQCEKLYNLAIDFAKLESSETILDAYCGIGTIGLCASKFAKNVIGVEINKEAVIDAKNNAKANNIKNANFVLEDASKFMLDLASKNEKIDVVFLDPPRKGSDEVFLNSLIKLSPKRIIYISCNPATLARDLAFLKDIYEINKIQPVDMFPFTEHVETICALSFKGQK